MTTSTSGSRQRRQLHTVISGSIECPGTANRDARSAQQGLEAASTPRTGGTLRVRCCGQAGAPPIALRASPRTIDDRTARAAVSRSTGRQ